MVDVKNYMVDGDESTERQVKEISGSPAYENEKIRIMLDAHYGKGSCVGFTSTHSDKIVPNTVGVDIACRVNHLKLPVTVDSIDKNWLAKVDRSIRRFVPAGSHKRRKPDKRSESFSYDKLHYWQFAKKKWNLIASIGTLGSGNHYIELDRDAKGNLWLAVHTGSRNLGLQVCNFYQKTANENHPDLGDLAYIEGEVMDHYLNEMRYCNDWSLQNHLAIMNTILVGMRFRFEEDQVVTCIHNYVDVEGGVIRKGAISARKGEVGAVPLNMRGGTLLVKSHGDADWNYSLPHGAGRVLSRKRAFDELSLDVYKEQMAGIYSSSVAKTTLDEAPGAYKPANDIIASIEDHCEVVEHLTPIYNYKAK